MPELLTIRFAKNDCIWDGSSPRVGAEAFIGSNVITLRPALFEKFKGRYGQYGRLLRNIEITKHQTADHLLRNLTLTIIHEAAHCILSGESPTDTASDDRC